MEKTYYGKIELLSDETNPNPEKRLVDFKKAALNSLARNSTTQENRAVIST